MTSESSTSISEVVAGWSGRSAFAVVDLDAIATNVQTIQSLIGPDVELMAVVKANAYGHGAVPVAKVALESGATRLGVATVDEAAQLRAAGIAAPILVFSAIGDHERAQAIGFGLSVVVSGSSFARALAADARASLAKEQVSVHLKIDTGMRRFGVLPEQVLDVAQTIASLKELRLDGIMTHLASADAEDPASAHHQVAVFDQCVEILRTAGLEIPMCHVANSAATLRFPAFHRDMVRLGIGMYGLVPDIGLPLPEPMRPVLTIHGRVARVFDLCAGDQVGYGGTYTSPGNERAALIPLGYADGYRRGLSNKGWMAIRGERAAVLGRVSMDQTVVRIPDGVEIAPGEPVVIVGNGVSETSGAPTFDDLAPLMDTIGYELVSGLAARLPKLYIRNGQLSGIADLSGYRALA